MAFFVALQVFAERVDMREAGVDNQEALKNTEIINNTINRLNKAGGGTLFFPSGDYLTASIHMKVILHLNWRREPRCVSVTILTIICHLWKCGTKV